MIRKNIHACQRLLDLPVTQHLVLVGLETDSPLLLGVDFYGISNAYFALECQNNINRQD